MNIILLIFFAIPLAVIVFSIALQKILKCPPLVAGIIFAIGLLITFLLSSLIFLAATLIYTLISYITALITCFIMRYLKNNNDNCRRNNCCRNYRDNTQNDLLTISSNCCNTNNGDLLTIDSRCGNGNTNNLLTISSNNIGCNNNNGCSCCYNDDNDRCRCENDNTINQANTINGVIRIVDNKGNGCCNNNDTITTRINVVPNTANNGRTGCICGRYRRR